MGTYRRKDTGRIFVKFQISGTPYRQSVPEATSIAEGKIVEAQIRKSIFDGKYGGTRDIEFRDFIEKHFKAWWKGNFRSDISYTLETFCRAFQGKTLKEISQLTIEAWKSKRAQTLTFLGKPPHPATIQNELALLSTIFELACDNEFLSKNPMRKVRRYSQAQIECQRTRTLLPDEQERLEPALEKRGEIFWAYMIARHAGMRQMEILRLRHEDINLRDHLIQVGKGKNDRARILPILEVLKPVFLAIPPSRDGYLFQKRTGKCFQGQRSAWGRALDEAGIKGFRFHDLRHTFTSELPPDPYLRAAWLGHSRIETSIIYSHTSLEQMRQAAEGAKVVDFAINVTDVSRQKRKA